MEKRKIYIVSGLIMFLCMGAIYSWSVFRIPLISELEKSSGNHINATMAQMPYTVFLMFYSFTMPFSGKLIKKLNPNIICIIRSLLVGFAWLLAGESDTIYKIILSYGVLGGIGVGIIYGVPIAVVSEWFPDKKGFAVGITLMGFGLSPFISAPVSNFLIENYGVFNAFKVMGITFIILLSLISLIFKFPTEKHSVVEENKTDLNSREMIKTKSFYALWICFIIGTYIGLSVVGIATTYAVEVVGLNKQFATYLLSFFAIFNGLGRPLFGHLVDKLGTKKTIYLSYTLIITASLLQILKGHNIYFFVIGFVLFFMNLGGWLSIVPAANINIFGRKFSTQNYGILFTAYGIGAFFQGMIGGYIKEKFGSYLYMFYPFIGLCIIGIFITTFALKKIKYDFE